MVNQVPPGEPQGFTFNFGQCGVFTFFFRTRGVFHFFLHQGSGHFISWSHQGSGFHKKVEKKVKIPGGVLVYHRFESHIRLKKGMTQCNIIPGVDYDWFWIVFSNCENFDLKWDLNPPPLDSYSAALPTELFRCWDLYHFLIVSCSTQRRYQSKGRGFKSHFRSKFWNFDKILQNQS